jgi:hypothetical protein
MPPNPYLRLLFPDNQQPVNQYIDAEYLGPALIRTGGLIEAVSADGTCQPLGVTNYVHAITPETAHSVHYFVQTSRNFRLDDPSISPFGDTRREISCAADAGAIRVRKLLSQQIVMESGQGKN